MELEGARRPHSRSGRLIMHVNKVSHVKTINLVAKDLGEDEDCVARRSGWERRDNQDGHFGGRGGEMIVAARR